MTQTRDRIPPQSLEAEAALIGACIQDPVILDAVATLVRPEDFYALIHDRIFGTLARMVRDGAVVGAITVAERLRAAGQLEQCGGFSYLSSLATTIQTVDSAVYYAKIVREKASLRRLISAGQKLQELGFEGEDDVSATLGAASSLVVEAIDAGTTRRFTSMAESLAAYEAKLGQEGGIAYRTPWEKLDALTSGFVPGELVVWAGDGGIGKSQALTMLTAYTAERYGRVALFATEMGRDRTVARFVALYSGVSARRQRNDPQAPLTVRERGRIAEARKLLELAPIDLFDAAPAMTTDDVVAQCRHMHRERPLKQVTIDTFGMLADLEETGRRTLTSVIEASARKLVRLSQELGIVIHLVQHLNRDGTERTKKPSKRNLRNGGNLEGHASTVILLWQSAEGKYYFIVDKARDGCERDVEMERFGHRSVWLEKGGREQAWCEPLDAVQDDFMEGLG